MKDWISEDFIWLATMAGMAYFFSSNKALDIACGLGLFIGWVYYLLNKKLEQLKDNIDQEIYRAKKEILDELEHLHEDKNKNNKDESLRLIYESNNDARLYDKR
jgi:uncharacterized membrane protein YgaE (UPF0421/DUF939 family)